MKPPFFGTKVIGDITLDEVEPLIESETLFAGRWQFRKGTSADEWQRIRDEKAVPILERIMAMCRGRNVLGPLIAYGYFRCRRDGSALVVEGDFKPVRFDFPRERHSPNRCVADFFPDGFIAIQLATVGSRVIDVAADLFKKKSYSDAFFLKGLAAEAAEATAKYGHRHVRRELGAGEDQGERFSPGYPSFPDLFAQRKILKLLDAGRIGVTLTETCQLIPEYSTTAIISIDPQAEHFSL